MKIQALALAAALAFGGAAAMAAPNDTAKAPATPEATHVKPMKHHKARHAMKHHKKMHHAAMKHHARHYAKRHHREHVASLHTDVNSGSRDARMDAALQKYRSTRHG